MTKEQALIIWESLYGDRETAYDFASHPIRKEDYLDDNTGLGWDVDLIQPLNRGGYSANGNYVIEALLTKAIRDGKASFKLGNFSYEVRKGRRYGTYSIYDVTNRNQVINMDPTEENQEQEYNEVRMKESLDRPVSDIPQEEFKDPSSFFHLPSFDASKKVETQKEEPVVEEEPKESEIVLDENNLEEDKTEEVRPTIEEAAPINEENLDLEKEIVLDEEDLEKEETEDTEPEEDTLEEVQEEPEEEKVESKDSTDNELLSKIEELTSENQQLKESLEQAEDRQKLLLDEKQNQIDSKENEIQELNAKLIALQNEKESIAADFESYKANNDTDVEYQRIQQSLSKTEEDLQNQILENESIKATLNEKDSLLLACQNENEEQKKKIQEFENLQIDLEDKIASLTADKEELSNQNQQLKEQNTELEETLALEKNQTEDKERQELEREEGYKTKLQQLEETNVSLKKERDILMFKKASADDQNQVLLATKEQLEERIQEIQNHRQNDESRVQGQMQENEALLNTIQELKEQKESLVKSLGEKDAEIEKCRQEKEDVSTQLTIAYSEKENLKAEADLNETEKNSLVKENQNFRLEITTLHEQRNQLMMENQQLKEKNGDYETDLDTATQKLAYLCCGGDIAYFDQAMAELTSQQKEIDEAAIVEVLQSHPKWISASKDAVLPIVTPLEEEVNEIPDYKPEVSEYSPMDLSDLAKQQERASEAKELFRKINTDADEVTDFAGRTIRIDNYQDDRSKYGWDFISLEPELPNTKDNVILGNKASLKDVTLISPFTTNGHRYQVIEENGHKKLMGLDEPSDVFDYRSTMSVIDHAKDSLEPFVYIFIKFFSTENNKKPDNNQIQKFINVIEKTVKRVCINSFLALHTSGDYAFLTFDGKVDSIYSEVKRYTVLLNSYRYSFQKEGWLNAIIVCSQVNTELSNRFYSFEKIASITQDKEMCAIIYDLNKTSVVDTTIKKMIHFGPSIVDHLKINPEYLKDSYLGQGNFAQAYGFTKKFKQTSLRFNIHYEE